MSTFLASIPSLLSSLDLRELDVLIEALGPAPSGRANGVPRLALGLPVPGEPTALGAATSGTSPTGTTGGYAILIQA